MFGTNLLDLTDQAHPLVQAAHHPTVQAFDIISFVSDYTQANFFLIVLAAGNMMGGIFFDIWMWGLLVFEYDKANYILDQKQREALRQKFTGGGGSTGPFENNNFIGN